MRDLFVFVLLLCLWVWLVLHFAGPFEPDYSRHYWQESGTLRHPSPM